MGAFFRKITLILGDMGCLYLATHTAIYIIAGTEFHFKNDFHLRFLGLLIILMFVFFSIYGLFSLVRKRLIEIFLNLIVAVSNMFIIAMAITFIFRDFEYSRAVIGITGVLAFILLGIWQSIMHKWEVANLPKYKIAIMATEDEQKQLAEKIDKTYGIAGCMKMYSNVATDKDWKYKIDSSTVVLIGNTIPIELREEIVHYAKSQKKFVTIMPTLYEISCQKMYLWKIDDLPVQRLSRMLLTVEQRFLKRSLDLTVATIAIIILSPIMLITAIIVKIDSPGPALYSQVRVGRFGKEFKVHKFRSMRQDAEKLSGPVLAGENDPRITRFGRFMRATRLDELPQLINVIAGDMSIVGPRPERPFFVEQFIKEKPEYAYRHNVKPGITGFAQVAAKYNTTAYDKLVYDLLYIQQISIKTDLLIMLQTLKVLITKESTEGVK